MGHSSNQFYIHRTFRSRTLLSSDIIVHRPLGNLNRSSSAAFRSFAPLIGDFLPHTYVSPATNHSTHHSRDIHGTFTGHSRDIFFFRFRRWLRRSFIRFIGGSTAITYVPTAKPSAADSAAIFRRLIRPLPSGGEFSRNLLRINFIPPPHPFPPSADIHQQILRSIVHARTLQFLLLHNGTSSSRAYGFVFEIPPPAHPLPRARLRQLVYYLIL